MKNVAMKNVQVAAQHHIGKNVPDNWHSLTHDEKLSFVGKVMDEVNDVDSYSYTVSRDFAIKTKLNEIGIDSFASYWESNLDGYPTGHTYHVAFTDHAMEQMGVVTMDSLAGIIKSLTSDECKKHIHFYTSLEVNGCHDIVRLDSHFTHIKELSADDFPFAKYDYTAKISGDDDPMLYITCSKCGDCECQPIDQQRHHFGGFRHLGENVFACINCPGAPVEVDVASKYD